MQVPRLGDASHEYHKDRTKLTSQGASKRARGRCRRGLERAEEEVWSTRRRRFGARGRGGLEHAEEEVWSTRRRRFGGGVDVVWSARGRRFGGGVDVVWSAVCRRFGGDAVEVGRRFGAPGGGGLEVDDCGLGGQVIAHAARTGSFAGKVL